MGFSFTLHSIFGIPIVGGTLGRLVAGALCVHRCRIQCARAQVRREAGVRFNNFGQSLRLDQ
jgi:hypothetical protein